MSFRTSPSTDTSSNAFGSISVNLHLDPAFGMKGITRFNARQVRALSHSLRSGDNNLLRTIHCVVANVLYERLCESFNLYQDDEVRETFILTCLDEAKFHYAKNVLKWNLSPGRVEFLEDKLIEASAKMGQLQ